MKEELSLPAKRALIAKHLEFQETHLADAMKAGHDIRGIRQQWNSGLVRLSSHLGDRNIKRMITTRMITTQYNLGDLWDWEAEMIWDLMTPEIRDHFQVLAELIGVYANDPLVPVDDWIEGATARRTAEVINKLRRPEEEDWSHVF